MPANTLSGPVRGALWMIGAAVSLVAMAVLVRFLMDRIDILQQIFLRNVVSLLLLTPWILRTGLGQLKTARLATHGLRNVFLYSGNVAWFFAVTLVPLADLAALQFTMPLFTVVMAALFLGERVGVHRWTATAVGFLGALVILRPGVIEIGGGSTLVLVAALFYSVSYIVTKRLASTESGNLVVFYMSVFIVVLSFVPALFVWVTPAWSDVPLLIALGVTGYTTHYSVTRAMAAADASYVVPFDYLRLPMSAAVGLILFAERLDPWTWAGATIIFAAAYYNTWREKQAGGTPTR